MRQKRRIEQVGVQYKQTTGAGQQLATARRITIRGRTYYIDGDGTAVLRRFKAGASSTPSWEGDIVGTLGIRPVDASNAGVIILKAVSNNAQIEMYRSDAATLGVYLRANGSGWLSKATTIGSATAPAAMLDIYHAVTGGSGDFTNCDATVKYRDTSQYPRFSHIANSAGVACVYNYETGKDVYWGESSDTGEYIFRGRSVNINSKLKVGGGEFIKIYTYTHTLTAGEVTAKTVNLTITAVTLAAVRMVSAVFYDQSTPYVYAYRDWAHGYATRCLLTSATNCQITWPNPGATTSDTVSVTIIEAA